MIKMIFFLGLLGSMLWVQGQETIPVICANSKDVSVRDGAHFRKGYWYIMPEVRPDYYPVENPKKPHRVSFYTDHDSISFEVTVNKEYDFVILLNGKDSCFTRISTMVPQKRNYHRDCDNCVGENDTIPFTVGLDNKTYLKAGVNQGKAMTFQFDLGATNCVVNESIADESSIHWEGTAAMGSVQGTEQVKSSKYNTIHAGNLRWDSIPLFSTAKNGWRSKGIIGNSILQEQIVELNYDNNILVFHQQLPRIDKSYHRVPFEMRDGVPFIPITIDNGKGQSTNWFMFDNGYSNCLLVDKEIAQANLLYGTMKSIGSRDNAMNGKTETVLAPKLFIGDYAIQNVPIDLQNPQDVHPYERVIAGNDLLKRFNVIIDYQESMIYFKPNALMDEPFDKAGMWLLRLLGAGGVVLLLVALFLLRRRFTIMKR
ncbi:MAG: retroviral-like aspartic protease family protein [Chitinophagaceae bacterium]